MISTVIHDAKMTTKHGLTSVSAVLQRELSRRFNSLLDLTVDGFKPIYTIATFLDLKYRIVLSDEQIKFAKSYLAKRLKV